VRPGDRIVIASGLGREVFLMGAVGEQKAAGYTDGMTLVELISGQSERGGGYNPTARLGKVLIVRGALENPTTFDVDLSRILKGLDPDVYLMPGDIVYVPEKPYRFARDLTRAVVLTFVRTFASEAGAELVDETIFLTAPSDPGRAP
jgi:protein involved in polysaccharide export with SLBB domain